MAVPELRCIVGFNVEGLPSGYKTTTTYRPFPIEIDVKKYGTHKLNCPSCGNQFEVVVFPGLPLLKAIKVGVQDKEMGMGLKLNLLFIFLFPLLAISLVLFPKLFAFLILPGGLIGIVSFVVLLVTFVMFVGTLIHILGPLRLRCFVSGGLNHQVLFKGRNNSVPAILEELNERIPYYR